MPVWLNNKFLVVTTIAAPNEVLLSLADGARQNNYTFICIGDRKSPDDFALDGIDFYSIDKQSSLDLRFVGQCPENSYSRKNIGYLLAMAQRAQCIKETDDDNYPRVPFWDTGRIEVEGTTLSEAKWVNIYSWFAKQHVWPRGFPLEYLHRPVTPVERPQSANCVVQQGLADGNPDVDAIYRLSQPLEAQNHIDFSAREPLILNRNSWCPFNSQNTTWWPPAYPLMYLPSYCSFRMTDIWRSFVAQVCLWQCDYRVAFFSPTVYQVRNEHDLFDDFKQELPGYLNNAAIIDNFEKLNLRSGEQTIFDNMKKCYGVLVEMGLTEELELSLLESWKADLLNLGVLED